MSFVHLHNHTEYSILDGHGTIKDYVKLAKADGQTALAITDHGNMAGAIDFYVACKDAGIKPIIGCELYVDWGQVQENIPFHLTVLAANTQGYRDLIKINTAASKRFYHRPRIPLWQVFDEELFKNMVVLTGCPSSPINRAIRADDYQEALRVIKKLEEHSKRVAIEIMYHRPDDEEFDAMQKKVLTGQFNLADEGFPLVLTNDCHYASQAGERTHQGFLKSAGDNVKGIEFDGDGFYLKTSEEMHGVAYDLNCPESWENTQRVADFCEDIYLEEVEKPSWYVPSPVEDPKSYLLDHCWVVAYKMGKEYEERFTQELEVISTSVPIMNSYIVASDLMNYCRSKGIKAAGRGSMAGSLISYLLGITTEDPVKYNLNFKRAVNPARLTIPDFDIDVSSDRRQEVLDYISEKYPESAPIASYSERKIKGAARWVLRALNYSVQDCNEILKDVDENSEDISFLPEDVQEIVAGYLGLYGNMTVHPAGIMISGPEKPIADLVPLGWVASSKLLVTQFNMYTLKKIDMFKLDILGLSAMDTLSKLEKFTGIDAPTEYDDPEVFGMLSMGYLTEIFQLDGYAARIAIKELGITSFEDMVAINTLVRPGASQFIPMYHSGDDTLIIQYPPLKDVLGYTRGLILYQEQVMEIAAVLAGFDDLLQDDIKEAIKYFRADVFAEMEPKFLAGCTQNGHDGSIIWESIKAFAGYAFNRAHAVTYAAIAYKMAWFKKYYPAAFFAAVYDASTAPLQCILESSSLGVLWCMPDINTSSYTTSVQGQTVVLGLGAIKGIGAAVSAAVEQSRVSCGGFVSYQHFRDVTPKKQCNIRYAKIFIEAGAMRSIGEETSHSKMEEYLGFNPSILDPNIIEQISIYTPTSVGGFLISTKEIQDKNGNKMGFLKLVGSAGNHDVTLFKDKWPAFKKYIKGKPSMLPMIVYGRQTEKGFIADGGEHVSID